MGAAHFFFGGEGGYLLLSLELVKLRTSNFVGTFIGSIGTKASEKCWKIVAVYGRIHGVPKIFRAPMYRAHCAVGHLCDSTAFLSGCCGYLAETLSNATPSRFRSSIRRRFLEDPKTIFLVALRCSQSTSNDIWITVVSMLLMLYAKKPSMFGL